MSEFNKRTVTIPAELEDFVNERKGQPEYAGNLSAYVRSLILKDREARATVPRSARLSVRRKKLSETKAN